VSWFCAATFTWAGNRYFTFAATRARGPLGAAKEWLRFLAANAVGGLVNIGLYSVLVRFAPPPFNGLTLALVCGVLLGLVFNFTLSKKIVFKGPI
jgi:putative flippase GtrA